MADNVAIKDGSAGNKTVATDELSDSSHSPKVTLLLGDSTTTQVAPAISMADDAAFTPGTSRVNPAGFVCDESGTDSVDEGDVGAGRMTADRKIITRASIDQTTHGTTNLVAAGGNVAHDAADSGDPVKVGHVAIAHGTNPTAVAAADRTNWYANRAGVPFVIGGHPNAITESATITDANGAQTDAALVSVSSGTKIVVTALSAICDADNSGKVAVRIGFAASTLPAVSASGTVGMLLEGKFAAGGGNQKGNGSGILGVGADGEDLRITCDDPAGGALYVTYTYYTIES